MARLLRTYGVSRLRPPIAVGVAVTFRPLDVVLSVTLTRSRSAPPQRITRSDLQPPTTVGAPNVYRAVSTRLAPSSRLGRVSHPHPVKPAVVAGAVTFGPVTIRLVRTPRAAIKQRSELQPPAFVAAPVVYGPLRITLAIRNRLDQIRRAAHSKYNPPATLAPPPQPPTAEQLRFRTWLTRIRPPKFLSRLRPPTIVGVPVTFAPLQIELARAQRARYRTRSFSTLVQFFPVVPPPTVEQLKTRVFLTRRGPVRLVQSEVKPPTVTAPPLVFRPVSLELAPSSRLARAAHWKLKPPIVVSYPVTAEQRYIQLYLAPPPKQGRRTIWDLRPPTAVIPQVVPPYLEGYERTSGNEGLEALAGAAAYSGTAGMDAPERGAGLEALIRDTGP